MKILMQNRSDAFEVKGGDTVAMLGLKKYLEALGVQVDISLELDPNLKNYNWVLIFNILRTLESYAQFKNAKKQKKKIALMPIYWATEEYEKYGRSLKIKMANKLIGKNGEELLKNIIRIFRNKKLLKAIKFQFQKSYFSQQKEMIKFSDIVLPNSYQEKSLLEEKFGNFIWKVIYNGIDLEVFKPNLSINDNNKDLNKVEGNGRQDIKKIHFLKRYKIPFEKFGLCVARFDERKNQLNLIKAVNQEKIPIVFIGAPAYYHQKYFQKCQKIADPSLIKFFPFLEQEEVKMFYQFAHFHALVSWLETPGLVNLEAGILGCNLVISKRGPVEEYFKEYAFYCEPNDISSIRRAIKEAFEKPRGYYSQLPKRILENFTWEKSALKLKEILENCK